MVAWTNRKILEVNFTLGIWNETVDDAAPATAGNAWKCCLVDCANSRALSAGDNLCF
jgi:hypothetical protein